MQTRANMIAVYPMAYDFLFFATDDCLLFPAFLSLLFSESEMQSNCINIITFIEDQWQRINLVV